MENGWIKLHRRLIEWEWYSDINVCRLFIHLLLTANHKPKKWRGVMVEAGSLITGRHTLSEQTGLSEQQIRTATNKLKSTGEITSKTTSKYTIISITNWASYQQDNQQDNQQATSKQPASNQQVTTNKNEKKERMKEETFEQFWDAFNDKRSKKEAYQSWAKIEMDDLLLQRILKAAKAYAIERKKIIDRGGTPKMAQGWLTGERWNDDTERGGNRDDKFRKLREGNLSTRGRV